MHFKFVKEIKNDKQCYIVYDNSPSVILRLGDKFTRADTIDNKTRLSFFFYFYSNKDKLHVYGRIILWKKKIRYSAVVKLYCLYLLFQHRTCLLT